LPVSNTPLVVLSAKKNGRNFIAVTSFAATGTAGKNGACSAKFRSAIYSEECKFGLPENVKKYPVKKLQCRLLQHCI
jgi:hypothetical protein